MSVVWEYLGVCCGPDFDVAISTRMCIAVAPWSSWSLREECLGLLAS